MFITLLEIIFILWIFIFNYFHFNTNLIMASFDAESPSTNISL